MKQQLFSCLLALFLSASATGAFAAAEGKAVGVNPDAAARAGSGDRTLVVGADVSIGETIVTGNTGQVQIIFSDNTRLVVGPRSSLLIETYMLASANTASKLTINALSGSFRFISGNSPKSAYSITTPTASIAVRGTEFDILAMRGGTRVMLYSGALQLCNAAGDCKQLTESCQIGVASNHEAGLYLRNDPARAPLSQDFRYADFQGGLLADFWVSSPKSCVEQAAPQPSGQSSEPTGAPQTNRSQLKN